jgi:hypothetical protein
MRCFLRALYFKLAGLSDEAIYAAFTGYHSASQWLIQINAQERRASGEEDSSDSVGTISLGEPGNSAS